jgi:CRP-like cAMP-binding protein
MNLYKEKVVQVLSKTHRTPSDLEFIREITRSLEDFNSYIEKLSKSVINQLLHSIKVQVCPKKSVVFHKGDPSNCLYVIFSGSLDVVDPQVNGKDELVARASKGKLVGERGLVRRLPRSLSVVAHSDSILLTVSSLDFCNVLESSLLAQLDEKRYFLLRHLPYMDEYSKAELERLSYSMEIDVRYQGDVVVSANESYD